MPMTDAPVQDLPVELRLVGHRVRFRHDVTGQVKATCRAFPQMLVRDDHFEGAVRKAQNKVRQLMAARLVEARS